MTVCETAIIASSFCMIVFPTFVIIPSAFAFYKKVADFWFAAFHISAFGIAAFTLMVAAIYSVIALFDTLSGLNCILGLLIVFATIVILYFLFQLQQWLWEVALFEVIVDAEAQHETESTGKVGRPEGE